MKLWKTSAHSLPEMFFIDPLRLSVVHICGHAGTLLEPRNGNDEMDVATVKSTILRGIVLGKIPSKEFLQCIRVMF